MNAAAETIVLASPEKLNAASPYVIASLEEIDGMEVPEEALVGYRELGVVITRA
jgi:hypothetical protein